MSSDYARSEFRNGDPLTAEDVIFSFERYKGAAANELKTQVKKVEAVDPHRVRFHLHEPWPDFMATFDARNGSRLDRPEGVHREGRRRWVQAASGRGGAVSIRESGPRRRPDPGGQ